MKLKLLLALFFCMPCLSSLYAQSEKQEQKKYNYPQKTLQALRVQEAPKIDGELDEAIWQQADVATQFIKNRPNPGPLEKHPTEVRILYDDAAIYVGAIMHDVSQDSIYQELGRRDDLGNTDFFGIFLDTYLDEINGFGFVVTPAGVQLDARYSSNGEDWSWNAVWESSTKLNETSWVAEMKIPYSAIRFSSKQEQVWGLNFMRNRQSTREGFFWNYVDPAKDGFANQWGRLEGLRNIEAPLRLSFTPYISAYLERYPTQLQNPDKTSHAHNFNFGGGMDVKYGINDAFTLDMTLIPDFSQVQSDNRVLNLSPFEQQFDENRPFFLEGTELFNKGDFFYSRRIGGGPVNAGAIYDAAYEGYTVTESPSETKMINGTKVSGRTESGLGIGIFNAVVGEQYAELEDKEGNRIKLKTQPLTNYNIAVFDQSLKNNSYVTLVNTNVMRQGSTYDANLTGLLFRLANKGNKYAIDGKAALSQQFHPGDTDRGYMYRVGAGKVSGNFQFSASHTLYSDKYNPNDLGILFTNNSSEQEVSFSYNIYDPFWKMLNLYTTVGAVHERRFRPNKFQNLVVYGNVNGTFKNFLSAGINVNLEPVVTYDFFEPRLNGRVYAFPVNYTLGGWVSTDYRKRFATDVSLTYRSFDEHNRHSLSYGVYPRFRVNNQLSFNYGFEANNRYDDMGFVKVLRYKNEQGVEWKEPDVVFGLREVRSVYNSLSGSYTFNNRMSLRLRVWHNWSKVNHTKFFRLQHNGGLEAYQYEPEQSPDVNYNSFNLDMVYSWWFAPGSEISVVWKNAFEEQLNEVSPFYFDNFSHTLRSPQSSTFSVKVLYYLDYLTLQRKLKKG
ncbi:DUF5916 domain-containing protein [Pontibacter mangrovi]|uniref:Carbohydrate binding family 9 domain-containing protein n=1 Tax=Pontibacter mangrovi TaxID=2589816 RepID=A0A501VW21_9BACT|nr:DUF5916 domain-containing protein [Pontibacter mangrovi]TPE40270.1 carbohydrate binding family 9 domain-containing protein [Pontibacter mangrovi]